jgi:hypothetical protein
MKIRTVIHRYAPWAIIAICFLEIMLTCSRPSEAFAWIIAAIGWLAYKFDA